MCRDRRQNKLDSMLYFGRGSTTIRIGQQEKWYFNRNMLCAVKCVLSCKLFYMYGFAQQ